MVGKKGRKERREEKEGRMEEWKNGRMEGWEGWRIQFTHYALRITFHVSRFTYIL